MAAACARHHAARGRRCLAVDAAAGEGLPRLLGLDPEPGIIEAVPDVEGLSLLTLTTEAALDQYVRITLRSPISPRALGPVARIFDYVATAAPAVREILTIGKIGHEVRRGGWDCVVVDGPATGHVVELLDAPAALGELVGIGPLASESAWLSELLADGERTSVVVVTTPEELPVNETIELVSRLGDRTELRVAGLVANRIPAPLGPASRSEAESLVSTGSPLAPLARAAVGRADQARAALDRLDDLGLPRIEIADGGDPLAAAEAAWAEAPW